MYVRPSRQPLCGFLRMTVFIARKEDRHPEERRQARLEDRSGHHAAAL
jgi:hypothetical protein